MWEAMSKVTRKVDGQTEQLEKPENKHDRDEGSKTGENKGNNKECEGEHGELDFIGNKFEISGEGVRYLSEKKSGLANCGKKAGQKAADFLENAVNLKINENILSLKITKERIFPNIKKWPELVTTNPEEVEVEREMAASPTVEWSSGQGETEVAGTMSSTFPEQLSSKLNFFTPHSKRIIISRKYIADSSGYGGYLDHQFTEDGGYLDQQDAEDRGYLDQQFAKTNKKEKRSDGQHGANQKGGRSNVQQNASQRKGRSDGQRNVSHKGGRSNGQHGANQKGGRSDVQQNASQRKGRSDGQRNASHKGGRSNEQHGANQKGGRNNVQHNASQREGRSDGQRNTRQREGRSNAQQKTNLRKERDDKQRGASLGGERKWIKQNGKIS